MEYFIIVFALFVLVIIPLITRQRKIAAVRHFLNRKKQNKENRNMKELATRFIGKECIVYTITAMDSGIKGTITEVSDGGLVVDRKDSIELVNLEYVTRIREWPHNTKGKKKQVILE